MFSCGIVRMAFNAEFMSRMDDTALQDEGKEPAQVFWRKESGRSTAQVKLTDHRGLFHEPAIKVPFLFQYIKVFFLHVVVGGDLFITPAIST